MTLEIWLLFAAVLFAFGIYAVVARRDLIAVLIGVELMLNAASLNFMAFNRFVATEPVTGQIIVLFIMGLAAAEVRLAEAEAAETAAVAAAKLAALNAQLPARAD